MKVLGITASLRPGSNTKYYMEQCLAKLAAQGLETQLVSLRHKKINPCLGCYACTKEKRCAQTDDDFAEIMALMEQADGIVLGSPVYLSSVAPQMMSLLARATFVAHWNGKFLAGKVGGPITVARRAGHNMAFSQLLLWFFINGITVPGSTYWTVGMAGAGGAHDAAQDEEGLTHVANFADNMAKVMAKLFA
ncbi:MAG: flavodoxin family protein [Desulfarculus sp.]|nr:flavodoxin family protein [Pseudomonadota bacterium]MBV1716075.1 flavodoxin family protein [Desulfarculus sp.]MBU4573756.1 flavodoxin family protein [Pseudomonadota bacterium]MBU4596409.1 flavodoxin family protein [Pseudomonadota bacterium]MBV1738512.1 flavodoxin family protein [Desulfarculus sp.]